MAYNYKTKSYLAYSRGNDFSNAVKVMEDSKSGLIIPKVVNAAFCCELLLKAIIIMEKRKETPFKEHKLSELFKMLNPETQQIVKKGADIFDWDTFMQEASNAFVEWRYLHEEDKVMCISVSELLRLHDSLKAHYEAAYPLATIVELEEL